MPFLWGGPVWDDSTLIFGRLVGLDLGEVGQLWAGPVTATGPGSTYYRPLSLSLMALVGRLGMPGLHLLALLAHAVSVGLMVHLCRNTRAPVLAGLIVAVHPLAAEVLGWASALPDALALTLGLLAATAGGGLPLILLVVAGALCKETALLLPLCFGLAGMLRPGWWRAWGIGVLVVLGLRYAVGVQPPPDVWHKVSYVPEALGWSLSGLLWPWPLSAVRDVRLAPPWSVWIGAFVILGMAVSAGRKRAAWAGLGLVVVAPALALPTILDGYLVGERYMYPALAGAGLWAALTFPSFQQARRLAWSVYTPLLVISGCLLGMRSMDWRSDGALFQAAIDAEPRSSLAWHLRGMVHLRAGEHSPAADAFGEAIHQGHPYPTDHTLRLRALVEAGRVGEALAWAEQGPAEGLTAGHLAWWARAALEAGDVARASELIRVLRTPSGMDGPPWVPQLAEAIESASQDGDKEAPLRP